MTMPENYITIPADKGSIHISEDVIASIAGTAVIEVEGVTGLTGISGPELGDLIGKKPVTRGIRVSFDADRICVDLCVSVRFGANITVVGTQAQKAAAQAVESVTGVETRVNVRVTAVTFEK